MKDKTPLEQFWDEIFVTPVAIIVTGAVGFVCIIFGGLLFLLGHPTLAILALLLGGLAIAASAWLFYKA